MPARLIRLAPPALAAAASAAICAGILWWSLDLGRARLDVPFAYTQDALLMQMVVRNAIENPWYTWTPRLGAPEGQDMADHPCADTLDILLVKAIALFSRDAPTVLNVFYLLTYPLVAWAGLAALRGMGLSYPAAVAGGLLYTFLPYHYMRGVNHVFLTSYFVVPLVVPAMVRLAEGWMPFAQRDESSGRFVFRPGDASSWLAVAACLLLGASNPYYGFYAVLLFAAAGLTAFVRRPSFAGPAGVALLAGLVVASIAVNMLPTFLHGGNDRTRARKPAEAEWLGLKLAQAVLPARDHRFEPFRQLTAEYYEEGRSSLRPLNNENDSATLGTLGTLGLVVIVLGLALRRPDYPPPLAALGELSIAVILIATIGGLGAILNLAYPQMRAYNRISVFLAFFALAGLLWVIDHAISWRSALGATAGVFGLASLTAFGVWDQVTPRATPNHEYLAAIWKDDRAFVAAIRERVPSGSMIANLPLVDFPEAPPVRHLFTYQQLIGYLHSDDLRWSTGAIRGRPGAQRMVGWEQGPVARWVAGGTPDDIIAVLTDAGYAGIVIDWPAYPPERRDSMRRELTARLGPGVEHINNIVSFYRLPPVGRLAQ